MSHRRPLLSHLAAALALMLALPVALCADLQTRFDAELRAAKLRTTAVSFMVRTNTVDRIKITSD